MKYFGSLPGRYRRERRKRSRAEGAGKGTAAGSADLLGQPGTPHRRFHARNDEGQRAFIHDYDGMRNAKRCTTARTAGEYSP